MKKTAATTQRHTRQFGSQGRLFTNGFVTTPLCCPSRASIFTGRYAHNHGVQDNRGSDVVDPETMVQSDLKSFGYQTALFGKYLNNYGGTFVPPGERRPRVGVAVGDAVLDAGEWVPGETLNDYGFYTQLLYGFKPRWVAGLRFDYVKGERGDYERLNLALDGESLGRDLERAERWRLSPGSGRCAPRSVRGSLASA